MYILLNDFSSVFSCFGNIFFNKLSYYSNILFVVMFLFICYRVPYCYSPYLFVVFLIMVVFCCFVSLFLIRVFDSINHFFSNFIPVGTPMYICFLVCVAETISYIIRPLVLILRPFINISLGCFGAVAVGGLTINNGFWLLVMFILFFYEIFVALVHWYIVISILEFSMDH
uniref:ATPase subunit 6 n=1 Tax=Taenia crassiceps TaxID=6207 RepID=Q9TGJ3_9CEST|nr:ATP synthase F0 subunit 6 [Taenia crassiceps]AAG13173.2 ATPase subunit 6 [Taenia crassiceps]BAA83541.3 ATPase subunit 6 [Taenia crassiceps]